MSSRQWDGTLLDSLRVLSATGIAILRTRIELFGTEFKAELSHALNLLVMAHALLLIAVLAATFTGGALIVTFWDSHRVLVSWLVAGAFGMAGILVCAILVRTLRAKPAPFAATRHQLELDIAVLRRK